MSRATPFVLTGLCLVIAVLSWRFVVLGFAAAFDVVWQLYGAEVPLAFKVHVVCAPVALALSGFQFFPRLRSRWPGLHRWTGRVASAAILLAGVSALALALMPTGRPVAAIGFGLLAVLWVAFTLRAVARIRAGDRVGHRADMIRAFALTFAAVTLRLQLTALFLWGFDYPEASLIVAWTCWVPNLLVAEWLVRRSGPSGRGAASGHLAA